MGLAILLLLMLFTGLAFWRLARLRGAALQLALAALMLGGAGYALQGRRSLAGAPKPAGQKFAPVPLTEPRQAMLGRFNQTDRWLTIAEGYASRGQTEDAVNVVRSGLKAHPDDFGLWIGLANALVDHSGMITPAADLAFARARAIAPKHPAPLFFEGLALARSGKREEALLLWRRALALTPPGTSYRPIIVGGIEALEGKPQPKL